jgi:hypothetical protein
MELLRLPYRQMPAPRVPDLSNAFVSVAGWPASRNTPGPLIKEHNSFQAKLYSLIIQATASVPVRLEWQHWRMKMQNDTLPDATVKPTPPRRFYRRLSRKAGLGILGITLLAAAALGAAVLNHAVTRAPNRVKGVTGRLVWYVADGRLRADMHTLSSMFEYVVFGESDRSRTVMPTNMPIAGNVPTTSPNS